MKFIASIVFCVFLSVSVFATGIEFRQCKTLKQAKTMSQKEQKLIFVDCYVAWCNPCRRLSEFVFPDSTLGLYFNSQYVNVRFNMDSGDGMQIARHYHVYEYPTMLWLDSTGAVVYKLIGGLDAISLLDSAKRVHYPYLGKYFGFDRIALYPNPASDQLNISIDADIVQEAILSVVDVAGRPFVRESLHVADTHSIHTLDVSGIQRGFYFLILSNAEGEKRSIRFVKN